ncbi:MAG: sn-glycerol-1-phosphate dehydrogenase [Candidatus Njordarchaeales archaeon]
MAISKFINGFPIGQDGRLHIIKIPSIVVVGEGAIEKVPDVVEKLGIDRVLMVTGTTTWNIAGNLVFRLLKEQGVKTFVHYVKIPSMSAVEPAVSFYYENGGFDVVIGVGGGKNLDVGKVIAKKTNSLFISVPTTSSHDGIASPFASLIERKGKYSLIAATPIAVIADTEIIANEPTRFFRAGVGDVIANINAVEDWKLARDVVGEYYGEYAANLAVMSAMHLIKNINDLLEDRVKAVRTLIEALISSGIAMGIAGSSRPGSGAEHLFSHALDGLAKQPALHGEQCALGTVMMLYYRGDDRWTEIRDYLLTLGLKLKASSLGLTQAEIIEALIRAPSIRPDRYTILHHKPLTSYLAKQLAKETGVI